jgi:hypothetical protein
LIGRRKLLLSAGATGLAGVLTRSWSAAAQLPNGLTVSVTDFGARPDQDSTFAIQQAIRAVESRGGGTVLIPGRFRCGNILVSGRNVRLQGQGGWLVDGRITIGSEARNIDVADLGVLDTRNDPKTYLADISGRDCRFTNVQLVKDPPTGGYQMYMRQKSSGCRFQGLALKGSNGIMVAGTDHLFDGFQLQSRGVGGDDAFAIKALGATTRNITIRNGTVQGYSAIVSIGSEIGIAPSGGPAGAVRDVLVENVSGDRCTRLAFFKPGALIYDWHDGVVERVQLRNLTLNDPTGEFFQSGIQLFAARGAIIRDVYATGIRIVARAKNHGVVPTSAIDITLVGKGAPARIEDVTLQVVFIDPYSGAPHGPNAPGYPIDHFVRIGRLYSSEGTMSGIHIDVEGRGSSYGGIVVGPNLDGAVTIDRAVLTRVATNPPAATGGGGIWSDSRLNLRDVRIETVKLPKLGGRAFAKPRG